MLDGNQGLLLYDQRIFLGDSRRQFLGAAIQSVEGVSIEAATRAESASSLATNQTASTEGMAETALRLAELSVRLKEAMGGFRV